MPISNTMRSALVAAVLGAATAIMLAAVVLPGWAQNVAAAGAISIDNFTFTPQTLTVKAGTTVTWTNKDDIPHGIAANNNAFADRRHWTPTIASRSRLRRRALTDTSATFTRT